MLQHNVAQLLRSPIGTTRSYEIEEGSFQADELEVTNLHGTVRLTRLRGELLLQGSLEGEVIVECSRCLEPYVQSLRMDLELEYQPSVALAAGDDHALTEDDGVYSIDEHHTLDLVEAIREHVILSLPMQPLCRPDCAGICPICGGNRNQGACPGHPDEVDERMAVLARLLSEEDFSE
jgi:uncharacterized protein